MSIVFFSSALPADESAWERSNGATRRVLKVVNKLGTDLPAGVPIRASLGFLDKGNHSFIFINPENRPDDRIFGGFLNSDYGFKILDWETRQELEFPHSELWREGACTNKTLPLEYKADDLERYGLTLKRVQGDTRCIYQNSSVGGYGNSESKFAIIRPEVLICCASYKNRQSPTYYKFTEEGFTQVEPDQVYSSEQKEV